MTKGYLSCFIDNRGLTKCLNDINKSKYLIKVIGIGYVAKPSDITLDGGGGFGGGFTTDRNKAYRFNYGAAKRFALSRNYVGTLGGGGGFRVIKA